MYKNNLDSIFNLHSQKTLLPHQNFMKKTKESQPNNRCNVYSKGWRNSIPNGSQERLCWPCHYIERCFIQIGGWIPAQNNTTELQKKKEYGEKKCEYTSKMCVWSCVWFRPYCDTPRKHYNSNKHRFKGY